MIKKAQKATVFAWNFIFNHEVSPLRHIPDIAMRHYILQALGFVWAIGFAVTIGSYTFGMASVIGHAILIAAAAITISTWTAASVKPELFARASARKSRRKND